MNNTQKVLSLQLLVEGVNESMIASRIIPALVTLASDPEMWVLCHVIWQVLCHMIWQVLRHMTWQVLCHMIWQVLCHKILQVLCHKIWQVLWHMIWQVSCHIIWQIWQVSNVKMVIRVGIVNWWNGKKNLGWHMYDLISHCLILSTWLKSLPKLKLNVQKQFETLN